MYSQITCVYLIETNVAMTLSNLETFNNMLEAFILQKQYPYKAIF